MVASDVRVFLDANVMFSGVFSADGPSARLLESAVAGRFVPVASGVVLGEFVRNIAQKAPDLLKLVGVALQNLPFEVTREAPPTNIAVWRDATLGTDAPVVAAALFAQVDYLCTGDRGILAKKLDIAEAGLTLVTPRELLTTLEAGRR